MAAQLISYKRQLTQTANKLDTVVQRFKEEELESLRVTEDLSPIDYQDAHRRLEEGIGAIRVCTSRIESLLGDYATTLDALQEPSKKEYEDYDEYAKKAEEGLAKAIDYLVLLEARSRAFVSCTNIRPQRNTGNALHENESSMPPRARRMELPTLPVPTFKGNIWEWENFWSLFEANIHSQPLPELYKFNYLLNALKGDALAAIKKFHVSPENYSKAIEFLTSKYGNSEELVNKLIDRIDRMQLRSSSLKDQRVFFEELQVVVSQLRQKGENVNSQWLLKQVLSKFPLVVQRKVLEKKHALPTDNRFEMNTLTNFLEEVISSEETVVLFTGGNLEFQKQTQRTERKGNHPFNACMYCQGNHRPTACATYKTPQERSRYLREHKLCLICASPKHATSECKKRLCFVCQGAHHTSCCFKNVPESRFPSQNMSHPTTRRNQPQSQGSSTAKKAQQAPKPTRNVNQICTQDDVEQIAMIREQQRPHENGQWLEPIMNTTICELQSAQRDRKLECTFLPTGELTVFDPTSGGLRKVAVLLDTGAELSFIDSSLADELGLATVENTKLRLHTFGSNNIQEEPSRRVQLDTWDEDGQPLRLSLHTHKILTKALATPPILKDDMDYIRSLNIPLRVDQNHSQVKPLILLGCDQVWSLIREGQSHIQLPSGLHLLPTRIGQLVTGQLHSSNPTPHVSKVLTLSEKWKECWSLDTSVHVVAEDLEPTEEVELWTKYWELDKAGTEEFGESEEKVQQMLDQQVWDQFKETVEKREDGYYVRLPWKEKDMSLPDNRAIAYRRLVSTWLSLSKDSDLLDKYHMVFQEQLKQNIIEEVDENEVSVGNRVHYIPHQVVLTPHKSTTKLRIVFDASAHYRNSCSLNDTLHRGPVILPSLYGLLLRFRFGRIAIIADVEKAFLQVHLQEVDRDATRFLWLRDHNEPPSQGNIKVYRFTRVTFGLLSSPFLLAATIHFHLDQCQGSDELVKSIKENLYVDNLILSSDSKEGAIEHYSRTKEIFNELHMNLREFVSNDHELRAAIADKDKSLELSPKVLGIVWDSTKDDLNISCRVPTQQKTTKRTVASTIASIYDPMGWMLPLLHKAKIFLQSLWKTARDWDTPLTEHECEKWKQICDEISGFKKSIPRFLAPKVCQIALISFADASGEAMAACVYLRAEDQTHLLMAKTKLPSLNSKVTIPKLELNALTLAMRLTNSVITQLQSVVIIDRVLVLTDSEIVLNWVKSKIRHDAGPFIKNRVNEIQQIASKIRGSGYRVQFGHISSQCNPADCATRGLDKHELVNHFWWTGPDFIRVPFANWDEFLKAIIIETTFEEDEIDPSSIDPLTVNNAIRVSEMDPEFFQSVRGQTLKKVKRIVAYVMRFVRVLANRVKSKRGSSDESFPTLSALFDLKEEGDMTDSLKGEEIALAEKMLVRQHQMTALTNNIRKTLHHLNLKMDEFGIWRCFGRLGKSALDDETKFPMLVMQKSWLSKLLIDDYHSKGHPTTSHTMALIRQRYWIPKLRVQVTAAIRRCVPCQRFNNLPFKYPEQSDLPSRRVLRSRPFEHVGLDYFGPLNVKVEDGSIKKYYGCIITCLVTRLIHLDVVSDLSTYAFIQMLRRFFARRGIPSSITSDNAPTFTLGDTILKEYHRLARADPGIASLISDNEIQWNYITPFAPWQGGVYERLIRSVKLALYKFQGRATLSAEEISTVLMEIEAMLNTRPLVYTESGPRENNPLRPIDFLQNSFEIPFPLIASAEISDDSTYVPSEERVTLQSKVQAMEALKSSCEMPEKFWHRWQTEYLTSLRERHQREVGKQRGSSYVPKVGKMVLICDALQPRHSWKMGRIETLVPNTEGIVREAVVSLPSHRKIRRPLNLLVPLEIDDELDHNESTNVDDSGKETKDEGVLEDPQSEHTLPEETSQRYNFRPRQRVNYSENFVGLVSARSLPIKLTSILSMLMILCFSQGIKADLAGSSPRSREQLRCVPGGVQLLSSNHKRHELCAEEICLAIDNSRVDETIRFPPHVVLHDHVVQWKFEENGTIHTLEITCPAAPFCENIDCTLCAAILFNPECWPIGAIIISAIFLYLVLMGCYVSLYIPLVIGRPVRVLASLIWAGVRAIFRVLFTSNARERRQRRMDLAQLLAVFTILALFLSIKGCQEVNVFSHHMTECSEGKKTCKVRVSEVLKINPFKKDACLKLRNNSTVVREIRVTWDSLLLSCEPQTMLFTRDTTYHVIDSKRCPRLGSCKDDKCAAINRSSLIDELSEGNQYPGVTSCVESCGGFGCDCFWWGSGCLFYRVYLKPNTPQIFEIFKCTRWNEAAKLRVRHTDVLTQKTKSYVALLRPNVPLQWMSYSFTLSSITVPPLPSLNNPFITDGIDTALWDSRLVPPLQCPTRESAEILQCEVMEDCTCSSAETKMNCNCREVQISSWFQNLQNRLPVKTPSLTFFRNRVGNVEARIPTMTTSEIILTLDEDLETELSIEDTKCRVDNALLIGCYKCSKGAVARVTCRSSKPTLAEIICDQTSFTIKCNERGHQSSLLFSFTQAKVHMTCSVSCGTQTTKFELSGILKFTHSAQAMANYWVKGTSYTAGEVEWPDFGHIGDVFMHWYKSLILAMTTALIAVGLTYLFISTCGARCILFIVRQFFRLYWQFFRVFFRMLFAIAGALVRCIRKEKH